MKKFVALVLVLACCFSLCIFPASAAEPALAWGACANGYCISVSGAKSGNTLTFSAPRSGNYDTVASFTVNNSTTSSSFMRAAGVAVGFAEGIVDPVSVYLTVSCCVTAAGADEIICAGLNLQESDFVIQTYDESGSYSSSNITLTQVSYYNNPAEGGDWYTYLYRIDIDPGDTPVTAFRIGSIGAHFMWSYTVTASSAIGTIKTLYAVPTISLTAQSEYAEQIAGILNQLLSIQSTLEEYLPQILAALNRIISELVSLNADTDTIISILNLLKNYFINVQQPVLGDIADNVDAIYYVLTETLKDESSELSDAAADAMSQVSNEKEATAYYQESMQNSYDSLALGDFSFGNYGSGVELVGSIFSDMWDAFGSATIIFTFPLILGIALLVIGRVSKSQSRSKSDSKGKEDS